MDLKRKKKNLSSYEVTDALAPSITKSSKDIPQYV